MLVNRSAKGIELVMFGCVALEDNKKARVLNGLIGLGRNHGGVGPGSYYEPFVLLNGPLNRGTDEKMGCEGAAKMTLIDPHFHDGSKWKADGIDWTGRPSYRALRFGKRSTASLARRNYVSSYTRLHYNYVGRTRQ